MERPSYAKQLMSLRQHFMSIDHKYGTTVELNNALDINIPVITNNVYKDIILYAIALGDKELNDFIAYYMLAADRRDSAGLFVSHVISQLLSNEELDHTSKLIAQFIKNGIDNASVITRWFVEELMPYNVEDHYDDVERLGLVDTLLGTEYEHQDKSIVRAAELMCEDPGKYDGIATGTLGYACIVHCVAIAMLMRNNDTLAEAKSKIKSICNLMIFNKSEIVGADPATMGTSVLRFVLRGCEEDYELSNSYHPEIYLAVCVVEDIYDVNMGDLVPFGHPMFSFFSPGV